MEREEASREDELMSSERKGGLRIAMRFGGTTVFGMLGDTPTARAFARRLPITLHVSGTGIDFCGTMPFGLPYEQRQVHRGWVDGDINYNPGGGWFAILYADEENSMRYGDQVNLGRVEGGLDVLRSLSGSYDLTIERA